jgi:hypothetical protein
MAPRIANFPEWARHVLRGLEAELDRSHTPGDDPLAVLYRELAGYVPPARLSPGHLGFAVPLELRTTRGELRLITTITSFATAADVTAAALARCEDAACEAGTMTPQERYEDLVDELTGLDGVTPPPGGSGFGRGALRYRRKIFAMFVRGQLVVKLPAPRVDELVTGGHGERFDANKGTPMREWFSLDPGSALPWPSLAREALDFAAALGQKR